MAFLRMFTPQAHSMQRHYTLPLALLTTLVLRAQPQVENPGFETWTNVGQATQEPAEWSSLKTSDGGSLINNLAPQVCWRSTDAHTGTYSVNLRTVSSILGPANGLLTNGRVHAELAIENSYVFTDTTNSEWNQVMTSRPDSLVGWYKASPQPGDHAALGALLHVGEAKLPPFGTEPNWVGGANWSAPSAVVGQWTRFSVPFLYFDNRTPQWILFVIASGDSLNTQVGTEFWLDDVGLIYNVEALPSEPIAYVTTMDGSPLDVAYNTNGVPVGATDFIAELSDATGDFSNPVVIGTLNSTLTSDVIPCEIPAGTPAGTDYRIRVVTASPFYAPVDAGIIVELATGIASEEQAALRTYRSSEGLVVDLRGTALRDVRYTLRMANGQTIAGGALRAGEREVIPDMLPPGIVLIQLEHAEGMIVRRVWVP